MNSHPLYLYKMKKVKNLSIQKSEAKRKKENGEKWKENRGTRNSEV